MIFPYLGKCFLTKVSVLCLKKGISKEQRERERGSSCCFAAMNRWRGDFGPELSLSGCFALKALDFFQPLNKCFREFG